MFLLRISQIRRVAMQYGLDLLSSCLSCTLALANTLMISIIPISLWQCIVVLQHILTRCIYRYLPFCHICPGNNVL
uniref:Uncharacterized protein n=1 Tax=Arundo donax TaxID=35708 RepID=A0A0A8ZY81_ARUDO